MSEEQVAITEETRAARWPMIGVHAGLLMVAFGALYTPQPPGWFEPGEYVAFGLVGLALVVFAAFNRRGGAGIVGSGLLALGAATALWMSWDPQLASLPGLGVIGESALSALEPSLAHLGVLLALLSLLLQIAIDRRGMPREIPFAGAVAAASVLVIGLGILMTVVLSRLYDLSGTTGLGMLSFRTVSFALLMLVCATISGLRGVRSWPHLYVGLALLGAVARNLMGWT